MYIKKLLPAMLVKHPIGLAFSFSSDQTTTYFVDAGEIFSPGVAKGQVFNAGVQIRELFSPGAANGQIK